MKKAFQGLAPWQPALAAQEVVSHVLLAAFAIGAGIGYLGLMLVFAAELVLGHLASIAVYPERGPWRHLADLLKFAFAMAFLAIFVVATYVVATAGGGQQIEDIGALLAADAAASVRWSVAFAALSVATRYVMARRGVDPKFAWTRSVLAQNGATLVAMFLLIFAVPMLGMAIGGIVELTGVALPLEAALVVLAAAMRLFFALLITRMPEHEMRDIARQPYVD